VLSENKPNKRGEYQDAKPPYFHPQTPDTGEILGQEEKKMAVLQITESDQKFSKAEVVEWLTEEKNIPIGSLCRRIFETEQDEQAKSK